MPFVKNFFYKIIFLPSLIFFFVSCGAINDSKKPAGNHKNKVFDLISLSNSESNSESRPDNIKNDQGYSYYFLYELNRAHHYLKLVITKYPFSPAAKSARSEIGDFE
jgi:hypothetical protein